MKRAVKAQGMDERKKAANIALAGASRQKALKEFQAQLKKWQLAMPPHEPLVSDFGLPSFDEIGLIEYWIANESEAGYCGKFLFVFGGQSCPMHWHKTKHETFFIVRGKVKMLFDGSVFEMKPGDCLAVPPGKHHSFTGKGPALVLEVSTPCLVEDNVFENPGIPIGDNYGKELPARSRRSTKQAKAPRAAKD